MNLLSIMSSRTIEARNPYGLLRDYARDTEEENPALCDSQRVVCLTETPLEHVWMMCEEIADRGHPLAPYGLAFSKPWARAVGANPVWYIDVLRTGHRGADWLTTALANIAKQTIRVGGERYADPFDLGDGAEPTRDELPLEWSPIAEIAPFIETMGPVGRPGETRRRELVGARVAVSREPDLRLERSCRRVRAARAARRNTRDAPAGRGRARCRGSGRTRRASGDPRSALGAGTDDRGANQGSTPAPFSVR